jgi:LPXTG-motif cell wall-anchored protein
MIQRLLLLAGAFVLLLATPAHAQYTPGVSVTPANPTAGAQATLTACCFQPGSPVTFSVGGAALGAPVTANASGVATLTFTVPAGVSGAVTVVASGVDATGAPLTTSGTATVAAGGGGTPATTAGINGLPVTGSDSAVPMSLVAAGLVALGALMLFVVRTRRESVSH